MGGGTGALLPFHRAKLGVEGRLGVRLVREMRNSPLSIREVPSLCKRGDLGVSYTAREVT